MATLKDIVGNKAKDFVTQESNSESGKIYDLYTTSSFVTSSGCS